MNQPELEPSETEITRMLSILGNSAFEVRALPIKPTVDDPPLRGWFDGTNIDEAADLAADASGSDDNAGVYVTVNELDASYPQLVGADWGPGGCVTDRSVIRIRHLVLDIDPKKPEGVKGPASDVEHAAAQHVAQSAQAMTDKLGWPEPMIVDSGNGAYVIYRVDLPNTPESKWLLGSALRAFASKFNGPDAKIDTSVNNASRIFRLAGTINRKGAATEERPYRLSRIVAVPEGDRLLTVTEEQLRALVATCPDAKNTPTRETPPSDFDETADLLPDDHKRLVGCVKAYLERYGLPVSCVNDGTEFTKFEFSYCPFKGEAHADGRTAVLVWRSGTIGLKCFHEKCSDKTWRSLQMLVGKDFDEFADERATEITTGQITRAYDDPIVLAERHRKRWEATDGAPTVVCFGQKTYRYDASDGWLLTDQAELAPWIRETVQEAFDEHAKAKNKLTGQAVQPKAVRSTLVYDTFRALQSLCKRELSIHQQAPFWLEPYHDWNADDLLVFRNGVLNVRRYLEGQEDFIPPTARLFFEHQAQFDFDPQAPEPAEWLKFLDSLDQDDDWRALLQQIMGYCLWPAWDLQKFFVLVGPRRSGKGTITKVLENLVGGPPAVCSPGLANFADSFGLEQAIGKRLAIVPEIDVPEQSTRQIIATLKAITGGDLVTVNRKHQTNIPLRLGIKIIMVTNHFVALPDNSGALHARMLPLKLSKSFFGNEDPRLADKLAQELPGILLWALDGLRSLRQADEKFTLPQSTQDDLKALYAESAPLQAFLEERCQLDLRTAVRSDALYQIYRSWFDRISPDEQPLSESQFSKELRSAAPSLRKERMSSPTQKRCRGCAIVSTRYDDLETGKRAPLWLGVCPRPEWRAPNTAV